MSEKNLTQDFEIFQKFCLKVEYFGQKLTLRIVWYQVVLEFVFVALDGDQSSEASLTKIRGEALEKLKELKDNLSLEDDFDDLDFESSSEENE